MSICQTEVYVYELRARDPSSTMHLCGNVDTSSKVFLKVSHVLTVAEENILKVEFGFSWRICQVGSIGPHDGT